MGCGAVVLLIGLLLAGIDYSRRERVDGYVFNLNGEATLLAQRAGVVRQVNAAEGKDVSAGSVVFVIQTDSQIAAGSANALVLDEINASRIALNRQIEVSAGLFDLQLEHLNSTANALEARVATLAELERLTAEKVASARRQADRFDELRTKGYISEYGVAPKVDEWLERSARLNTVQGELQQTRSELNRIGVERRLLAQKRSSSVQDERRQLSLVNQQQIEVEARREEVVLSPASGTASNIAVGVGDSIGAGTKLATIVAAPTHFAVRLLVPTRAAASLAIGQRVSLRFAAYPYQRYGVYGGAISRLSAATWSAGARLGGLVASEPVFTADVTLDQQVVTDGVMSHGLRPGMLVSADLLQEKRTVLQAIGEPLHMLVRRLK